jgi:hypothetical protein
MNFQLKFKIKIELIKFVKLFKKNLETIHHLIFLILINLQIHLTGAILTHRILDKYLNKIKVHFFLNILKNINRLIKINIWNERSHLKIMIHPIPTKNMIEIKKINIHLKNKRKMCLTCWEMMSSKIWIYSKENKFILTKKMG